MSATPPRTRIDDRRVIYAFDADALPVAVVDAPARLTVVTRDAYDGRADALDVEAYLASHTPGRMNPCTGPIGIRGAQPGDTLAVTIDELRVQSRGYVAATPGTGLLGDLAVPPGIGAFNVAGDGVRFADRLTLPLRPMVGTIGVAPAQGRVETLSLGSHGGNLDFNDIRAGTTVHLPVRALHALLAIGDVHATMGDAEAHSGVNIAAEIDLSIRVIPGEGLEWPWFETSDEIMTVGVAGDLVEALRQATVAMERLLVERLQVSATQARMLSGAAVDLRLGQAGGYGVPVSAYAAFPKRGLAKQP